MKLSINKAIIGTIVLLITTKRIKYNTMLKLTPNEIRTIIENIKVLNPDLEYIPTWLIMGIIETESSFRVEVESHKGAVGLMQLLLSTYKWIRSMYYNRTWANGDIKDPYNNILAGMLFIHWLYKHSHNDWFAVIHGYNVGLTNYRKGVRNKKYFAKVLINGVTWII